MTNRTKQINGVEYPLTEQENTIRDAEEAQALIDKQTEEQVKAQALIDKQAEAIAEANLETKNLKGNITACEIRAVLNEQWDNYSKERQDALVEDFLSIKNLVIMRL